MGSSAPRVGGGDSAGQSDGLLEEKIGQPTPGKDGKRGGGCQQTAPIMPERRGERRSALCHIFLENIFEQNLLR